MQGLHMGHISYISHIYYHDGLPTVTVTSESLMSPRLGRSLADLRVRVTSGYLTTWLILVYTCIY
jgi:hypothetical protein